MFGEETVAISGEGAMRKAKSLKIGYNKKQMNDRILTGNLL